jgi:hypothetical protein
MLVLSKESNSTKKAPGQDSELLPKLQQRDLPAWKKMINTTTKKNHFLRKREHRKQKHVQRDTFAMMIDNHGDNGPEHKSISTQAAFA